MEKKGKPLRIKLVGGPSANQFEVFDAESGEQLTNVRAVQFRICRDESPLPVAIVEVYGGIDGGGLEIDAELFAWSGESERIDPCTVRH